MLIYKTTVCLELMDSLEKKKYKFVIMKLSYGNSYKLSEAFWLPWQWLSVGL